VTIEYYNLNQFLYDSYVKTFLLNLLYLAFHTWGRGNFKTTKPKLGGVPEICHTDTLFWPRPRPRPREFKPTLIRRGSNEMWRAFLATFKKGGVTDRKPLANNRNGKKKKTTIWAGGRAEECRSSKHRVHSNMMGATPSTSLRIVQIMYSTRACILT
jgi:hypothetical protein